MEWRFDPDLALYLPLYELDGGSFVSCDARGHIITRTGATWRAQGHNFDGTDDWLAHATRANFDWMHGAVNAAGFKWTVLIWVKLNTPFPDASQTFFASARYGTTDVGITAGFDNRSALPASRQLRLSISRGVSSQEVILLSSADNAYPDDSDFHLLAYTYNQARASGNANIYMDSLLKATGNKTANAPSSATSTYTPHIGSDGTGTASLTGGVIGEITILRRELLLPELARYQQATKWRYR